MSNVYFAIPSCRPVPEAQACLNRWKERGYRTAVLRQGAPIDADLSIPTGSYLGWARSTNILARYIIEIDPEASWIIGGGDDYQPDPDHPAEQIARECRLHFAEQIQQRNPDAVHGWSGTYGVMQPTGDRWQSDANGENALIDRIAGSPWMGRDWIKHSYLGDGPMWSGHYHNWADEELHDVAIAQGVYWARRDLTQFHDHDLRKRGNLEDVAPDRRWIYGEYNTGKAAFMARKAAGYPGSEPIPNAFIR
jgi:hypothetical protein